MAIIVPVPKRVLPVCLQPLFARAVASGTVTALVVRQGALQARVERDDMLWVRESTIVSNSAVSGAVRFSYAGKAGEVTLPASRWLSRPAPGYQPSERMPVHASRMTLIVEGVSVHRLHAVPDDLICRAGVTTGYGGYLSALLCPSVAAVFPRPVDAFRGVWSDLMPDPDLAWDANPEVAVVEFQAVHRNITWLAPGIGRGGVR
jgi:hypothetical protein